MNSVDITRITNMYSLRLIIIKKILIKTTMKRSMANIIMTMLTLSLSLMTILMIAISKDSKMNSIMRKLKERLKLHNKEMKNHWLNMKSILNGKNSLISIGSSPSLNM